MIADALDRLRRRWLLPKVSPGPMRAYLRRDPPPRSANWRTVEFCALDLETTGLSRERDAIVAVGWVVVRAGRVVLATAQHRVVRAVQDVAQSATIHGITDTEVARGVGLGEVLDEVLETLAGRVLLAHHASFDVGFLDHACRQRYGVPLVVPTVDTLALEARRYRRRDEVPPEGALRLGALRRRYGLPRYPAHDALSDALATAELFLAQVAHLGGARDLPLKHLLS